MYAHPLSFRDIAEGKLPEVASKPIGAPKSNDHSSQSPSPESSLRGHTPLKIESPIIEMVVCSFALHLVEKPSELFALLWELRCVVFSSPNVRPLTLRTVTQHEGALACYLSPTQTTRGAFISFPQGHRA